MKAERIMSYYGSKYRLAKRYDPPIHNRIIEPFAGGAGYSLHYPEKDVHLYDLDQRVCSVWDYVINADPGEIRKIPIILPETTVDDYPLSLEQRMLVGFWMGNGISAPQRKLTGFTKANFKRNPKTPSTWTEVRREMVAQTSERIKHWKISCLSFEDIEEEGEATWFIDPPYEGSAGRNYKKNEIDFERLSVWCQERSGQVQVCENSDSRLWLPFEPLAFTVGGYVQKTEGQKTKRKTLEVVWRNYP
jgi:site-specific DNA-adenine methylase